MSNVERLNKFQSLNPNQKLAAIDIGTHSVLLLILQKKSDGSFVKLADEATLTRIGEGMGSNPQFLASGMERTLAVLKKYRALCDQHSVEKIIAVGTAAFRKATNAKEFVAQVQRECGFEIKIISGEEEAALTWKAASTDFGANILVVDIGGGSTEIITAENAVSLPIGSILLTEKYCHSDPISEKDYQKICGAIASELSLLDFKTPTLLHSQTFVATAGTATTLGAISKKMKIYQHDVIHGTKISVQQLVEIINDFRSKTIEERKKIPGLEPGRADVILAGATIIEKIAAHFGFKEITVSDRGVRWGLVYD